MRQIQRLYDALIYGLAGLSALTFTLMVVAIVLDVILRNVGMRPIQATSAGIEYGLLLATMAGAPWLVREQGHVAVRAMMSRLPSRFAYLIDRAMLIVCTAILLLLAWRAGAVALELARAGSVDIRSVALPGWILPGLLCGGFFLMAIEFLRIFLSNGTYNAASAQH